MGKTFNTGTLVNGLSTDANGNVGIGGSPSGTYGKLSVFGGISTKDDNNGKLEIGRYSSGAANSYIKIGTNSASLRITNAADSADLVTFANSGNVGIGTTSPFNFGAGHKTLDVRGDGTTSIGALFVGNSDRTAVLGFYINPSATGTVGTSSNHALQLVTNDVERMRITSTGNVGIGTSSPSYRLETLATSATIAAFGTTSASGGFLQFRYSTSSNFGYIGTGNQLATGSAVTDFAIANDAGNIVFATGGSFTERMRISSSGTLSINGPRFIQQGLSRLCYAGTINGNQSITITLNVGSQSAVKITAAMNHYGLIDGYGCARMSWVGANPAFSEINISNVSSGNGGSWSFTHVGGGTINIIKNAGSYGGGGYFFVEVIGNDPISIA